MQQPRARGRAATFGVAVSLTVLVGLACEHREKTQLERGAGIFVRTCAGCHGVDGRGGARVGMNPPPRDLSAPAFLEQATPAQMRQVVRLGKGQMPAFAGMMSDADIDAVIAFLPTLVRTGGDRE